VRRRFKVDYTLAGLDVLLRRLGWSVQVPARLLDDAHQQLGGPLVVVWDGLNTHISGVMADLIAARDWLSVYQLPPYAHELNPVEMSLPQCELRRLCFA
jgi:hypothetical protein